jgi:RND family efflux transporter MFP subunit
VQGQLGGGTAAELVTVGSLDTVWAYADVFEQDLSQVRLGADVKVAPLAYQSKPPLEARIDYIAAQLDPATRTARVRCTLRNPDRALKAEMYATVGITVDRKRALAVPRSAVLRLGDQTVVFVQTGTTENRLVRFERRAVSVADVPGDLLPVERGLRAGEVVVTSGAILLSGMI